MSDRLNEDGHERRRRFFSLAIKGNERLRVALVALAAYVVTVELVYVLGYEIPPFRMLSPVITVIAPYALLSAGSVVALFIRPRLGIVFGLISLAIILVASLVPGYG
jgi:hypothetical protein